MEGDRMTTLQELLSRKEALERAMAQARQRERAAAIAQARDWIALYGLTMADLSLELGAKKGNGAKLPAKYRNQATGETWSGRGLQPRWLKAALAAGRKLDDFRI
jgi:DNA-binding protein H-NS